VMAAAATAEFTAYTAYLSSSPRCGKPLQADATATTDAVSFLPLWHTV